MRGLLTESGAELSLKVFWHPLVPKHNQNELVKVALKRREEVSKDAAENSAINKAIETILEDGEIGIVDLSIKDPANATAQSRNTLILLHPTVGNVATIAPCWC